MKLRLDEAATVTARLTRSGQTRTLKRVTRKLTAGSRQITLSRTLSNGKRYRIALRIVDDGGQRRDTHSLLHGATLDRELAFWAMLA